MKPYKVIRYIEFNHLFEVFFLSSILTILIIRVYLVLTGFPQIAFGHFHIAHMLWGGLLMMLSLFGFMTFLNDDFKPIWSAFGGIGFGFFIDELGKYITKDNNYHYQPTFAIIYIIFICLYILYKNIARNEKFSNDEYVVNAAEKLKEIIIHDLDKDEQEKALRYLKLSTRDDSTTRFLKTSFTGIENIPPGRAGLYTRVKKYFAAHYEYFISRPWFLSAVIVLFIVRSISDLIIGSGPILLLISKLFDGTVASLLPLTRANVLLLTQAVSVTLQAIFTVIGAATITTSRKQGYLFFRTALLISIFILEVFSYYTNPFLALVSTSADLLLLSILSYTITEEEVIKPPTNGRIN
jgi:hypothetical protein